MAEWQPASHPTSRKKSTLCTRQAHLSSPVFVAPPRLSLSPFANQSKSSNAAERCFPLSPGAGQPLIVLPSTAIFESCQEPRREEDGKIQCSPRRGVSPPGRPDRASRNAIPDPCTRRLLQVSCYSSARRNPWPVDRRLAEIDPEAWVGSRNQKPSPASRPASPTARPISNYRTRAGAYAACCRI